MSGLTNKQLSRLVDYSTEKYDYTYKVHVLLKEPMEVVTLKYYDYSCALMVEDYLREYLRR